MIPALVITLVGLVVFGCSLVMLRRGRGVDLVLVDGYDLMHPSDQVSVGSMAFPTAARP